MLRTVSVICMGLAIGLAGRVRSTELQKEVRQLSEYASALERMESAFRAEHAALPRALDLAAQGTSGETARYFAALREQLGGEAYITDWTGPALPLQTMCRALDLEEQLRCVSGVKMQTEAALQEQENGLWQRCRTTISLSLCLAAVFVIVFL